MDLLELFSIHEIAAQILSQLPLRDFLTFCNTCQAAQLYCQDDYLWKLLAQRDWAWNLERFNQLLQELNNPLKTYQRMYNENQCTWSKCLFSNFDVLSRCVIPITICLNGTISKDKRCSKHQVRLLRRINMFPFRSVWNEDYDGDEIVQPTLDIPVIGRAQGLAFMTTSHRDLPKKTEKTKPVQKEIRRNQRLETRRQRKIPYKR